MTKQRSQPKPKQRPKKHLDNGHSRNRLATQFAELQKACTDATAQSLEALASQQLATVKNELDGLKAKVDKVVRWDPSNPGQWQSEFREQIRRWDDLITRMEIHVKGFVKSASDRLTDEFQRLRERAKSQSVETLTGIIGDEINKMQLRELIRQELSRSIRAAFQEFSALILDYRADAARPQPVSSPADTARP